MRNPVIKLHEAKLHIRVVTLCRFTAFHIVSVHVVVIKHQVSLL